MAFSPERVWDRKFPNGSNEPIYISDWEWMFEIFETAMQEQGIEDGYCFSPFFWGYQKPGDFYSGFGGGCPDWYIDPETDTVVNGIVNDNMRTYLQCLNTWYQKCWLDKAFAEHTSDMFFAVDSAKVFQGKKNVLLFTPVYAIIQGLARRADHSREMIGWIRQQAEMPDDLSGLFS